MAPAKLLSVKQTEEKALTTMRPALVGNGQDAFPRLELPAVKQTLKKELTMKDQQGFALVQHCLLMDQICYGRTELRTRASCADLRPTHCVCAYTFVSQLALVRNSVRP